MASRRGPTRQEKVIMTEDKARKIAARQRMAETGEPYSVARRVVQDEHDSSEDLVDPAHEDPAAQEPDTGADEFRAAEQADQARRLADHARDLAEQARLRAERADEEATAAEEAADLTQEAADLTREWADDEDVAQAQRRADEARAAAEQARHRAERAEQLVDEAEEAADQAEGAADEAEELAGEWVGGSSGRPHRSRGHYRARRPPMPPRPPRAHRGRPDPDWDPVDRLQDRVEQMLQRFNLARDRADELISQAERIFGAGRTQPKHADPAPPEA
jgi:DNA repair exonuclease SbcCD ATPase subunit